MRTHEGSNSLRVNAQLPVVSQCAWLSSALDTCSNKHEHNYHRLCSERRLFLPQDIGARYPQWLASHADNLSGEDLDRYSRQHQHILDICRLYEQDPDNFSAIYEKLQHVRHLELSWWFRWDAVAEQHMLLHVSCQQMLCRSVITHAGAGVLFAMR